MPERNVSLKSNHFIGEGVRGTFDWVTIYSPQIHLAEEDAVHRRLRSAGRGLVVAALGWGAPVVAAEGVESEVPWGLVLALAAGAESVAVVAGLVQAVALWLART